MLTKYCTLYEDSICSPLLHCGPGSYLNETLHQCIQCPQGMQSVCMSMYVQMSSQGMLLMQVLSMLMMMGYAQHVPMVFFQMGGGTPVLLHVRQALI